MLHLAHIQEFLRRHGVEGPQQIKGYIPCQPGNYTGQAHPERFTAIGASGVTIATGCDLGQTNAATLRDYGLEEGIVNMLIPYLGLKKNAAIQKLHLLPLTLSREVADALDRAVHTGYAKRYVIPAYDKESTLCFTDLPPEAQSAVFSICFQKGVGGTRRDCPRTWGHMLHGDWAAASRELMTGFKQYAARRRTEGEHLQGVW